jgi:hypothetical protein
MDIMTKNVFFALQLRHQYFGEQHLRIENENEDTTEDDESPGTPQLTQTTHDRHGSITSSIHQHPQSASEFEIIADSEEERKRGQPQVTATSSPPLPAQSTPRKPSEEPDIMPSGEVLDHLRMLPPPLPIFESISDSNSLQFPGTTPLFPGSSPYGDKHRNVSKAATINSTISSIDNQPSFALRNAPIFTFARAIPLDVDAGTTFYASIKDKDSTTERSIKQLPRPRRVFLGVEIKFTTLHRNRQARRSGHEYHSEDEDEDELLLGLDEGQAEIQRARQRWKIEQARRRALRAAKQTNKQTQWQETLAIHNDNDNASSRTTSEDGDGEEDEYESSLDESSKRPTKKRKLDHGGSVVYSPQYSRQEFSYPSFESAVSIIGSTKTVDAPYGVSVDEINASAIVLKSLQSSKSGKRAVNPDAFCHQCRNSSTRAKPRSVCDHEELSETEGESPLTCGKRFCVPCLRKWYGLDDDGLELIVREAGPIRRSSDDQSKMTDPGAMRMGIGFGIVNGKWICPFCISFCMCTQCVQKRNVPREAFRPSANGRFDEPGIARPRLNGTSSFHQIILYDS